MADAATAALDGGPAIALRRGSVLAFSEPVLLASAASTDNRRGILAMLASMGLFVSNDALMKLASATFPTAQMMAVRGVFAAILGLGIVVALGEARRLPALAQPYVAGRALIESAVAFLFISALALAPLADLTAVIQATPILLTLILVAFGLERVGWRRWAAILVGFAGVLLIVRPGPLGFDTSAYLALGAAGLMALRDLLTRLIRADTPTIIVALGTTTMVGLAGFAIGALSDEPWRSIWRAETLLLVGAAVLVTSGNIALVTAFRRADMSVVSPFRYAAVVVALVIGLAVFGDFPDIVSLAGFALVVGAGVYAWHRERVRHAEAMAPLGSGDGAAVNLDRRRGTDREGASP